MLMERYLYRKAAVFATLALVLGWSAGAAAQYKRPAPRTEPRGVAVLERYADGKARLVPVVIFYEGKFLDAGFYNSTPVPFAIRGDTLYEVQRAGSPVGLFTVERAIRLDSTWFAVGKWRDYDEATKKADAERKRAAELAALQAEERRRAEEERQREREQAAKNRGRGGSGRRGGSTGPTTPTTTGGDSGSDSDKPTLKRAPGSEGDDTTASTGRQSGGDKPTLKRAPDDSHIDPSANDPDRPTLKRPKPEVAAAPQPDQPPDDSGRPVLRHNQGNAEQSGAELPPVDKANNGPATLLVAVSDPQAPDERSLEMTWSPQERENAAKDIQALASAELQKRLNPVAAPPKPRPVTARSGAHKPAGTPPPTYAFTDVDVRAYDIDYSNNPVVVFTGTYAAPNPAAPAGVQGAEERYSVTVVARQYSDGKMTKLFSSISNPKDLDNSPALRLVDAVDVDGDGRAELLFRKTAASGTGWLVQRVSPYSISTLFDGVPR